LNALPVSSPTSGEGQSEYVTVLELMRLKNMDLFDNLLRVVVYCNVALEW
jgi:hypothetical protein